MHFNTATTACVAHDGSVSSDKLCLIYSNFYSYMHIFEKKSGIHISRRYRRHLWALISAWMTAAAVRKALSKCLASHDGASINVTCAINHDL